MTVRLDTREARPLTSREISKVLCAILQGVWILEPDATTEFAEVLDLSLRGILEVDAVRRLNKVELMIPGPNVKASWRTAVGATIGGFSTWCAQKDLETAVLWVSENLPRMFPAVVSSSN